MLKTLLRFATCVLVILVGSICIYAQKSLLADTNANLRNKELKSVRIKGQGLARLFTDLSLSYDIPVGLEMASNDNDFDTYEINLEKGTLTELLDQFARHNTQYSWEINDGVVNIFPKDGYREFGLAEILKVRISEFSIKEKTSCWEFVDSLIGTPEVQNILKTYGMTRSGLNFSGAYFPQLGPEFRLEATNKTLKTILNTVVKESPLAKIWVIKKYRSNQTFYLSLNARMQNFSTNNSYTFQEEPGAK